MATIGSKFETRASKNPEIVSAKTPNNKNVATNVFHIFVCVCVCVCFLFNPLLVFIFMMKHLSIFGAVIFWYEDYSNISVLSQKYILDETIFFFN